VDVTDSNSDNDPIASAVLNLVPLPSLVLGNL
jgi:hypothetical protein